MFSTNKKGTIRPVKKMKPLIEHQLWLYTEKVMVACKLGS